MCEKLLDCHRKERSDDRAAARGAGSESEQQLPLREAPAPAARGLHGEGGIRTLDTGVSPYNGLANRRLQPLGHLSSELKKTANRPHAQSNSRRDDPATRAGAERYEPP